MTAILGINAYHGDSAACLVLNGKLVAAAEEERFRRIKHWAGFPSKAIYYCLQEAKLDLEEVKHIAINSNSRSNLLKKMLYVVSKKPELKLIIERLKNRKKRASILEELKKHFPENSFHGKIHQVEHHRAHLASAFLVSPFEEALAVSVDGFGDFASAAWGIGKLDQCRVDERIYFPHSLGVFYEALTQFLGFPHYGDEYKVMGLASYGNPKYLEQLQKVVELKEDGRFELNLDYFLHNDTLVTYEWEAGVPVVGNLFSQELSDLLDLHPRGKGALVEHHRDLACSVQAMYEMAFFHLLKSLHQQYHTDTLVLAGGCAMNSVANGKIYKSTPFRKTYVQPAAGDAGGAVGAALAVWSDMGGKRECIMDHAYWGPKFDEKYIESLLQSRKLELQQSGCDTKHVPDQANLCRFVANAIAHGGVVGWFQNRMEWGPRALGNRSILCDPRSPDMKDILNIKIKKRESFRPFAPSVLRDHVTDWFEDNDDVPFMMKVFTIKEEKRHLIPAVTHVDGSGRLQTVNEIINPLYYQLIRSFYEFSGVPMVLNTSLNENEPIVCKPEEALECFLRTQMDLLVLGNWIICRKIDKWVDINSD